MMRHPRSPILAGYLAAMIGLAPISALANPQNGNVAAGTAVISGQGSSHVIVNQSSDRAVINWETFNIGAGERTQFIQPGTSSIALNRVTGGLGPSTILGTIDANGRVFLVNPDGMLFGSTAVINTAGFLATTHDITDTDFMAGRNNFTIPGKASASIVNLGTITATNAGIAALVAPGVRNSGVITAELGKVALASNNGFTLDFYGDKLITMQVDGVVAANVKDVQTGQTLDALVKNEGVNAKLSANGGRVELTAAAARQVVDAVINNSGVIEANSVGTKNGMIVLGAATASTKGSVADTQKVKVSGTLSASGKNAGEKGGKIQITGENIALNGARIDASGKGGGGTVLIGGEVPYFDRTSTSVVAAPTNTSTTVTIDATSIIDVSGQNFVPAIDGESGMVSGTGSGGHIGIWANQSNNVAGSLYATGGMSGGFGGEIYVAALTGLAFSGVTDTRGFYSASEVSGPTHGWTYLGADGDVTISNNVTIGNDGASFVMASSVANSLANGNVQVLAGLPSGEFSKTGNLTVDADISWTGRAQLSLRADQDLTIAAGRTISNTSNGPSLLQLALSAGLAADGGGTVSFGEGASVDFSASSGSIEVWHNPSLGYATLPDNGGYATLQNLGDYFHFGDSPSSGRVTEYWWVNTFTDLQNISMAMGANFALSRDISPSMEPHWAGVSFIPLSERSGGQAFSGRFLGLGHTILDLTVNSSASNVGLFGIIGGTGHVANVNVTNAVVTAANPNGGSEQAVGVLAGTNYGTIDNVSVSGTIDGGTVDGVTAGGLVGHNNGTITNSFAGVNVKVGAWGIAGGLVGRNDGNIVGNLEFPVGTISDSPSLVCGAGQTCASGVVTVGSNGIAGGLVGENSGTIENAYATGNVLGAAGSANGLDTEEATFLGGLVGTNSGFLSNVLAFGDVLGLEANGVRAGGLIAGGLVGGNAGMIESAFAFGSVVAGDSSVAGGLVGASLPYAFVCGGECYYLSYGEPYGGSWDASISFAGAFGNVSAGANSYAGGAVGYVDGLGGEIPSLFGVVALGNVTAGAGSKIGGVVGMTGEGAYLMDVGSFGSVSATGANSYVGGIAGYNAGALDYAAAMGDVSATGAGSYVGGLVGANGGFISTSYAVGNVMASGNASYVGGLAGLNTGDVYNSGATGNVSATGSSTAIGGLVGWNASPGSLASVYYLASTGNGVYGTSNSFIGGLVGYNSGSISYFEVDPPVSGSGAGNAVGGAVGNNSGVVQSGTVVADVSSGSSSSVGPMAGINTGTISNVSFTGTVTGGDSSTPPDSVPPIDPTQYTPPTDSNQTTVDLTQSSDPTPQGGQSGQGGGSGGQGGNGGAGNNPPPPNTGPPPGPGIGRTPSEQRFSGVPPLTETRFLPGEVVVQVSNTISPERMQEVARALGITLIASQAIDGSGRVVYRFSTSGGKDIRDVIRALEKQQIVASAQPNYVFGLAEAVPARRVTSNTIPLPRPAPMRTAQSAAPPPVAAPTPSVVDAVPAHEPWSVTPVPPAAADASDATGALPPSPELSSDLQSDMASRTTGLTTGDAGQYIIDKLRLGVVHARSLGRNVTVAVIDSEIDTQHPDLAGVVAEKFDATNSASSPHPHGTGMAGAIASHRRLLGIAPGVRILAVKAFDETNTSAEATSFQILKGLDWAIARRPRIINMSFAGPRDLMLERAMQKAYDAGIVLIAAAGNAGPKSPPLYPAADVNVIAVSASDYADKPFAMANRGKHIAVAAPGVDVLVPSQKGGYQLTTGTSVAAAHVSGVAALLLEGRPGLTPKDVRRILTSTAKPVNLRGGAEIFGAGIVDPFQALSTLTARSVDAAPATRTLQ